MNIDSLDLALYEPKTIEITGQEEWREECYNSVTELFPEQANTTPKSIITGKTVITRIDDELAQFSLELSYAPQISCARCTESMPWAIKEETEGYFTKSWQGQTTHSDRELNSQELDEYDLDEQSRADLLEVIHDLIMTALPTNITRPEEFARRCLNCQATKPSEQIIKQETSKEKNTHSPFANLQEMMQKKPKQ